MRSAATDGQPCAQQMSSRCYLWNLVNLIFCNTRRRQLEFCAEDSAALDVLGHDDIDHAELYSREASQVRLAVQGEFRRDKREMMLKINESLAA